MDRNSGGEKYLLKNNNIILVIKSVCLDENLKDYKFFCFNGEPKLILVCSERFTSLNMCETFFDENWNLIPIIENNHRIDKNIKKPKDLSKMCTLARKLSSKFPFLRVDFYNINGKIYFGELTFFPSSGFEKFDPVEYDSKLGRLINLSIVKNRGEVCGKKTTFKT